MWYLVVPPIVVVLSLSFLLWYLSRKGADPVIAEKVLTSELGRSRISFPRTKEFFLRILEKSGQRFKVSFLRMHNAFHVFTQSVKARRAQVRTALSPETEKLNPSFFPREESSSASEEMVTPEESMTSPLKVSIESNEQESPQTVSFEELKKEEIPRPMVSEVAVHPERKKRVRPNAVREEGLIGRIARDPKDFTAYEELGDYYLEMENIKDAKECYRQVLKLSPVHRMVKIKIRRLEKLLTKGRE